MSENINNKDKKYFFNGWEKAFTFIWVMIGLVLFSQSSLISDKLWKTDAINTIYLFFVWLITGFAINRGYMEYIFKKTIWFREEKIREEIEKENEEIDKGLISAISRIKNPKIREAMEKITTNYYLVNTNSSNIIEEQAMLEERKVALYHPGYQEKIENLLKEDDVVFLYSSAPNSSIVAYGLVSGEANHKNCLCCDIENYETYRTLEPFVNLKEKMIRYDDAGLGIGNVRRAINQLTKEQTIEILSKIGDQ